MKLTHRIKLIIPRFKWWRKKREAWKTFRAQRELFDDLKQQAKDLEKEYNRLLRLQPMANISASVPLARLHNTQGQLTKVREILNGKQPKK